MAPVIPQLQYLVAFNNNAEDDPGLITTVASPPGTAGAVNVWTDITRYVSGHTVNRGRAHELSQFEAATCEVGIDGRAAGTIFNPWDTTGPYTTLLTVRKPFQVRAIWQANLLSLDQASFETSTAGWVSISNCTLSQSAAQFLDGTHSLAVTSVAAGSMLCRQTAAVVPGRTYTGMVWFRAAATGRSCTLFINWVDAGSVFISQSSVTVTDTTTGWTAAIVTGVAPAGAAFAQLIPQVTSTGGAAEVHYLDQAGVLSGQALAWLPGDPVTYYRFTGQVDSWATQWPDGSSSRTVCHSADLFRGLNTARIPDYPGQVVLDTPTVYLRLGDKTGTTVPKDSSGNNTLASLVGAPTFGNANGALLPIDTATCASVGLSTGTYGTDPGDQINTTMPGTFTAVSVECWFKGTGTGFVRAWLPSGNQWGLQINGGTGVAMAGGTSIVGSGLSVLGANAADICDGRWHHLVGTADDASNIINLYVDGVAATPGVTGAGALNPGLFEVYGIGMTTSFLQELAVYPVVLTAAQVAAHYAAASYPQETTGVRIGRMLDIAGWSAGARNIDTNGTLVQANTSSFAQASLLSHMQACEATESGALYMTGDGKARFVSRQNLFSGAAYTTSQATLGDNTGAGDIPYLPGPTMARDDIDLYNEAIAQRQNGAQQTAVNNTSVHSFGRTTWQPSGSLIGVTDAEVLGLAQYAVLRYAFPTDRFASITVDLAALAGSLPAVIPTLLSLDLLQRITIRRTLVPGGGGVTFSRAANIEHITETVTPDSWTVTFGLAVPDPPFWILGTSQLDSAGCALAF